MPVAVSIRAMTSVRSFACLHGGHHVAADIVVVTDAEADAALALGPVAAPHGKLLGLLLRLHHRLHDAHRAGVEQRCDEVVGVARNAHERHEAGAAGIGELLLQHVDADGAVLHVEDHIGGAGVADDLAEAGRVELRRHDAVDGLAGEERGADGIGSHGFTPSSREPERRGRPPRR